MGIALGCPEIRMAQHLLHRAEVGAALEQVSGERVAEKVGMNATMFETRAVGELAQDEKRAGAGQGPAARVEKELRTVPPVEVRPTEREVPANRLRRGPAERDEPLFVALAEHANDALLEGDATLPQPDRLGNTQSGAVEKLDERAIAQAAGAGADRRIDEALGLGRRERPWERARTSR